VSHPPAAQVASPGRGAPPKSLASYLRPYRSRLAVGVALLLATNALDKSIPWLLQLSVDALQGGRLIEVGRYALAAIGIAAGMWAIRARSRIQIFNIGRDVELDLRNDVLARIHRLGPSFFERIATGDVMSRATNDLGQLRLLVGFGLLNVINSLFAYGMGVALMMVISPKLTGWALLPFPLFLLVTKTFAKALFSRSQAAQVALARLADRAQENVAGVRLVRAYALEAHEEARFEEANQAAIDSNMKLVVLRGIMWPLLMLIGSLGTLIVLWKGGAMVLSGELTPGQFAAFNAYLGQLLWPTLAFGYIFSIVQRGRASFARVAEILGAEPDVREAAHPAPVGVEGALSVRGLGFERGERAVLEEVSLEVPAGSSLAVVGGVGSGKSTLAALFPRLLPTPEGAVFLDGADVTELPLRELRRTVGYAQQDPFLFSTTIERNIAFGLDDADAPDARARVRAAAKEAAILDEVESFPDGFETLVGERGVQLSGGQKQRVALARALLREPRVLILDDPLSAVDARTERLILEALDRAGEGRTLVLITQRIAAAARADRVVVLDEGKIVETGTHEALASAGGLYAKLAARQRLERELAEL
jgi:ATP-binding cassette subfamily B protein